MNRGTAPTTSQLLAKMPTIYQAPRRRQDAARSHALSGVRRQRRRLRADRAASDSPASSRMVRRTPSSSPRWSRPCRGPSPTMCPLIPVRPIAPLLSTYFRGGYSGRAGRWFGSLLEPRHLGEDAQSGHHAQWQRPARQRLVSGPTPSIEENKQRGAWLPVAVPPLRFDARRRSRGLCASRIRRDLLRRR